MKIPASHGALEASLREPEGAARGAAVVCHPHPLHGGTMHTKAVFRAAQALNDAGLRALRFNFRGVGASTGEWDEGVGERDDARTALDWLARESRGLPLVMGGFSFGSRIGLEVGVSDERVRALVGMGVTVELFDYDFLAETSKPVLIVQGEQDEFGAGALARETLEPMGGHVTVAVVPGAGHFFHDRFADLKDAIRGFFTDGAGAAALETPGARSAGPVEGSS